MVQPVNRGRLIAVLDDPRFEGDAENSYPVAELCVYPRKPDDPIPCCTRAAFKSLSPTFEHIIVVAPAPLTDLLSQEFLVLFGIEIDKTIYIKDIKPNPIVKMFKDALKTMRRGSLVRVQ
jgi:hypothetical protein